MMLDVVLVVVVLVEVGDVELAVVEHDEDAVAVVELARAGVRAPRS
jgi:hypothetical protein